MSWLIRICDKLAGSMDGQYVKEYDPTRYGTSPDGEEMFAHITVTEDPESALHLATAAEAISCYRLTHGIRTDGKPNRPLTAFTVEFITLALARKEHEEAKEKVKS